MGSYRLSNTAKEDLIRIYRYGAEQFGEIQSEKYFQSLFEYFEAIAERPLSFESVDFIKPGYRRCTVGSDSIYFKISGNVVDIMTIIGSQDLKMALENIDPEDFGSDLE